MHLVSLFSALHLQTCNSLQSKVFAILIPFISVSFIIKTIKTDRSVGLLLSLRCSLTPNTVTLCPPALNELSPVAGHRHKRGKRWETAQDIWTGSLEWYHRKRTESLNLMEDVVGLGKTKNKNSSNMRHLSFRAPFTACWSGSAQLIWFHALLINFTEQKQKYLRTIYVWRQ